MLYRLQVYIRPGRVHGDREDVLGQHFGGEESLLPDSGSVLTLTAIQHVVELPSTLLLSELSIPPCIMCIIWKTRGHLRCNLVTEEVYCIGQKFSSPQHCSCADGKFNSKGKYTVVSTIY